MAVFPIPRRSESGYSGRFLPSFARRAAAISLLFASLCGSLFAASVSKLNDGVLSPLRGPIGKRVHIDNLPLYAHGTATIDLEEFQVWAPEGKVIVSDGKNIRYLDPPPMRFFRGLLNGDPESFAYFSVDGTTGAIQGLITTRDGKFAVSASRRKPRNRDRSDNGDQGSDFDYFLSAADSTDEIPMTGQTWSCDVEKMPPVPHRNFVPETDASGHVVIPQGITGTQSYAIALEVETDDELYASAGNNATTVANYVTNITGAVSTIYNRDLHTNVVLQNVHVYAGGPGTDPWSATDSSSGLNELGDYYHANHLGLKRSAVVQISGKNIPGGIAWEGVMGGGDFLQNGHYGGAYAWCGDITGTGTIPDPNAINGSGTLYGLPTGMQAYWPLIEFAHELGHNMAGHHTHCVAITDAERIAAGFTDSSPATSASDFVDHCYASEGGSCFSGTNYQPGSQGVTKGTVMSYCHNVFLSGVPQSRFTFGQAVEASHHELDDYMLRAAGPIAAFETNIVSAVGTFSMTGPTGASTVSPNSTGNTATVSAVNGGSVTYSWSITGGSITAGATTSTVTYTAGPSGNVVLRATLYNTNGCGVTDTKTVVIGSLITAPTNLVATAASATSVSLTWTASAGATKYHVYRSANNSTYTQVNGEATTGTSYTDSTAASTAYLYKVRAVDGSSIESGDSNKDLATTVIFADDPLVVGTTTASAVHITELRTAIDAVRKLANGGVANNFSYTDATITPSSTLIKAIHINDLRSAINPARATLGLSSITYTDSPMVTAASTTIKAAHIAELRNGVK